MEKKAQAPWNAKAAAGAAAATRFTDMESVRGSVASHSHGEQQSELRPTESALRLSREMRQHGACADAINVLSQALTNAETSDDECALLCELAYTHLSAGDARKGNLTHLLSLTLVTSL